MSDPEQRPTLEYESLRDNRRDSRLGLVSFLFGVSGLLCFVIEIYLEAHRYISWQNEGRMLYFAAAFGLLAFSFGIVSISVEFVQ